MTEPMPAETDTDKPLRALIVGPLGPPHVSNQAIALAERGVDVHVGGNLSSLEELDDSVIEEAGIPVHVSPPGSRSTPWGMAATVRWLRALIRELEPDLVHAHWLPGFGFAAAAAGARPLALSAWGSDVYQAPWHQALADRLAISRSQLVMADSQDLVDRCIGLGANRERTAVVQWGVDLSGFTPPADRADEKRALGLGPGPVILSPRSLMPVYNIPTILEGFAQIGDQIGDAQLVLKHMGAQRIDLPPLPHADRVRIVGSVPYEEMASYYRAADVCVSLTSSDSSPRSIWEAMACAAPCVLSDLPWVRELIEPGRDALTVPIDAGALADAVLGLLGDEQRAAELGRSGRTLVEKHLDRDAQMDDLKGLYLSLAGRQI